MILPAFEAVAKALDAAGVRYLVVGGLAVNAHGYVRMTADIDLVIALDTQNILHAFEALSGLGYRPSVPVNAESFADPGQRQLWKEEKGMQVLNFHSEEYRESTVDLFVFEPFDFDQEYKKAIEGELSPDVTPRFVSLSTLMDMKLIAGRPRDLDDIENLQSLLQGDNDD